MFGRSVLIAACLVTMAGVASATSTRPEPPGLVPKQVAAQQTSESDDMLRASKFIGETVRNGKGEEIGTVDDLILDRGDKVMYAVISIGGFLGIGEKLVAVPFEQLKFGTKDVKGVVIYDVTKERLNAQPAFVYAKENKGMSRERFMVSAERRIELWRHRIDMGVKDATDDAKEMRKGASERVYSAWQKVKAEWAKLKGVSADAWQGAKDKFNAAMSDLEQAWDDATS